MADIEISGFLLDAGGNPLHVLMTFTPTGTPYVIAGGSVVSNAAVQTVSLAADGSFSVELEPGAYSLTLATVPLTTIAIVVPSSGGPYTLDQVANLPPPNPVYVPAGSGSPQGVVTASPGATYWDNTNGNFWVKGSGTGNTGWQQLIAL